MSNRRRKREREREAHFERPLKESQFLLNPTQKQFIISSIAEKPRACRYQINMLCVRNSDNIERTRDIFHNWWRYPHEIWNAWVTRLWFYENIHWKLNEKNILCVTFQPRHSKQMKFECIQIWSQTLSTVQLKWWWFS